MPATRTNERLMGGNGNHFGGNVQEGGAGANRNAHFFKNTLVNNVKITVANMYPKTYIWRVKKVP